MGIVHNIAGHVGRAPDPPIWQSDFVTVGVTGTNGKTTTTTWIAAALGKLGDGPVARATTLGFFVGDEKRVIGARFEDFVAAMKECHDRQGRRAAIELTSEALARGFARAWPCAVGVFTNLSHDHLDAHGSPEHYLASKAQLFVSLAPGATAVLNAADPTFELLREIIPDGVRVLTYAVPSRGAASGKPDISATDIEVSWAGTRITCATANPSWPIELTLRAIGEIYAENALAALLGAIAAGVPPEEARAALAEAPAPPGRFEVVHEKPYVVVDYAHSPDALARSMHTARTLADQGGGRLCVVFGAGGNRDRAKRGPMGEAARRADHVVLTSDNPRGEDPALIAAAIREGLGDHPNVSTVLDRERAITLAVRAAAPNDVVLIAGKGHETEQIIGNEIRHFSDIAIARSALAIS